MSRTVVWVPFRGDGGMRTKIFNFLLPRIESLGYEVIIRDSGHEPFSIANTWNLCAKDSGDWDKAIQWGADHWVMWDKSIRTAVKKAGPKYPYIRVFDTATKLTMAQTKQFMAGRKFKLDDCPMPFAGPRVVTRQAFDTVEGYDSRFIGWGHEDRVFAHCVKTLCGPTITVPGRTVMLKHPRLSASEYYTARNRNWKMALEYIHLDRPKELKDHIRRIRSGGA